MRERKWRRGRTVEGGESTKSQSPQNNQPAFPSHSSLKSRKLKMSVQDILRDSPLVKHNSERARGEGPLYVSELERRREEEKKRRREEEKKRMGNQGSALVGKS